MRYTDLRASDRVAAGEGWEVFRVVSDDPRSDHVVWDVVHHTGGRLLASHDEVRVTEMLEPLSIGCLGAGRRGAWWSVAVRPDVVVLTLDTKPVDLAPVDLAPVDPAPSGRPRHLLHRVAGPLAWRARLSDGSERSGTEALPVWWDRRPPPGQRET